MRCRSSWYPRAAQHRLHLEEHHPDLAGALVPGDEEIERRIRAFLRWNAAVMVSSGDRRAWRGRWPQRYVPVLREPLRSRLQPLLQGQGRPRRRRPDLHPGSRLPRCLRPRLPRGPTEQSSSSTASARGAARRRQGPPVLPAPAPHARLLGVPDRVDGAHRPQLDLPGSLQPLPANRGIKDTSEQHVWAFLGDGEMGEPESLGAIRVAAREELDNLTLVVNCNLRRLERRARQRQDHPGARGQLPRGRWN